MSRETSTSVNTNYGRKEGENTSIWLERLIGLNAPAYMITAVQQILISETSTTSSTHGNDYYFNI